MKKWIVDGPHKTRVINTVHLHELFGYITHCVAIVRPGKPVPVFYAPRDDTTLPLSLSTTDLDLLIQECRSQLDQQSIRLAEIRSRSLAMATLALTELGLLSATAERFIQSGGWPVLLWVLCFLIVVLGLLGMVSIASSRADFFTLDPLELWRTDKSFKWTYTNELVNSIPLGQCTLDTRVTVFRVGILLMTLGAVVYSIIWILAILP